MNDMKDMKDMKDMNGGSWTLQAVLMGDREGRMAIAYDNSSGRFPDESPVPIQIYAAKPDETPEDLARRTAVAFLKHCMDHGIHKLTILTDPGSVNPTAVDLPPDRVGVAAISPANTDPDGGPAQKANAMLAAKAREALDAWTPPGKPTYADILRKSSDKAAAAILSAHLPGCTASNRQVLDWLRATAAGTMPTGSGDGRVRLRLEIHCDTDGDFRFDDISKEFDPDSSLYQPATIAYRNEHRDEDIDILLKAEGGANACRWAARDLLDRLTCAFRTHKAYLIPDVYAFLNKDREEMLWADYSEGLFRQSILSGNYEGSRLTLSIEPLDAPEQAPGTADGTRAVQFRNALNKAIDYHGDVAMAVNLSGIPGMGLAPVASAGYDVTAGLFVIRPDMEEKANDN